MTDLILTRDKETGLLATYPKKYLEIFPNLECAEQDAPCADCVIKTEPETVEVKEPLPKSSDITLVEPTNRKKSTK